MPQRWNAPDFSGIVDSFLRPYLATKQAKEQELQDKLMYELAERRQIEDEKYRQYLRDKEAADQERQRFESFQPKIIETPGGGASAIYPQKPFGIQAEFGNLPGMPMAQPKVQELIKPQQKEPKTPGGFNLGAGQARFEFDPATGQYRQVASLPGRPTAGGGYTRGQAWDDAYKSLVTPGGTTEKFTPDKGYERTVSGKINPPITSVQPRADSLYNMQNYGQFNAPAGAIQQAEPSPVFNYQEDVEEWVQAHPEDQDLLQKQGYFDLPRRGR